MNIIKDYLNSIKRVRQFSFNSYHEEDIWTFTGDGEGDFKQITEFTTENCILNYIAHCKDQIKLAEEYYSLLMKSKKILNGT